MEQCRSCYCGGVGHTAVTETSVTYSLIVLIWFTTSFVEILKKDERYRLFFNEWKLEQDVVTLNLGSSKF